MWSQNNSTYKQLCNALLEKVEGRFNHAQVALKACDLVSVQERIEFLELVQKKADTHIKVAGSQVQGIPDGCINALTNRVTRQSKSCPLIIAFNSKNFFQTIVDLLSKSRVSCNHQEVK